MTLYQPFCGGLRQQVCTQTIAAVFSHGCLFPLPQEEIKEVEQKLNDTNKDVSSTKRVLQQICTPVLLEAFVLTFIAGMSLAPPCNQWACNVLPAWNLCIQLTQVSSGSKLYSPNPRCAGWEEAMSTERLLATWNDQDLNHLCLYLFVPLVTISRATVQKRWIGMALCCLEQNGVIGARSPLSR